MKKLLLTTLIVMMLTPLRANAFDWGSLFRWLFFGESTTQTTVISVDDVNKNLTNWKKQVKTSDSTVETSFLAVVPLLTTKTDAAKIEEEFKAIKSSTATDNEKDAKMTEIITNYTTTLKGNKVGVILIIKTLSDADKQKLTQQIGYISQEAEKYYQIQKEVYETNSSLNKISSKDDAQKKAAEETEAFYNDVKTKHTAVSNFTSQVKTLSALAGLKM